MSDGRPIIGLSSIQVAELGFIENELVCDRNKPFDFCLCPDGEIITIGEPTNIESVL